MAWFRRAMPKWASKLFRYPEQWQEFRAAVQATADAIAPNAEIDDDEGMIVTRLGGMRVQSSMLALAELYVATSTSATVFDSWATEVRASARTVEPPTAWDDVMSALRVQLYRADRRPPLAREIAMGLWRSPVIDLPNAMMPVTHEMVASWDQPIDDIFEIGETNLVAGFAPIFERKHAPLLLTEGTDYHAAAMSLTMSKWVRGAARGALVGIPTRYTAAVLPIDHDMPGPELQRLLAGNQHLFDTGEGALSPALYYWWPEGHLQQIDIPMNAGPRVILWPPPLEELLQ